jgi:ornithine cyclodeaminase/alanine dehydrogenase-like protein (mu-crystallin family)
VTDSATRPLRHLTAADVGAAMPPLPARLVLAERTMVALATPGASQLPSKTAVHPRGEQAFAHAMPALLRGDRPAADLLGIKWVTGVPANAALGLPAINATVLISDPATGLTVGILDGGPITAQRTAAVSGVAIARFAPAVAGRPTEVALIGAGVQGRSHLPVLGHVLPGARLRLFDHDPARTEALADLARATPGIAAAEIAPGAREAIVDADVVVTVAAFTTPERRQVMTPEWLGPEALVVPVDYATYCSAAVARSAALFLVDERGQFLANRDAGQFDDYPDPAGTLGEAILAASPRPAGRVVVTHLGVGLADVVFGAAILDAAERLGLGTLLER